MKFQARVGFVVRGGMVFHAFEREFVYFIFDPWALKVEVRELSGKECGTGFANPFSSLEILYRVPRQVGFTNPIPSSDCVSVGLLGSREQGNLRKCSLSALESALRNRGALGSAPERALEGAPSVQNIVTTGRAPSTALLGALPRAPRFLRALLRALGEHFRRFPCSRLPRRPTDKQSD